MLIEFQVGNFRSIKDPVTLSMVATELVAKDKALDEENVVKVDDDLRLLTSAAIYGANASGKSNLALAASFMRDFVLNSSRETQAQDRIRVERFRLNTETENAPSFFQVVFLLESRQYRYGFEVTAERVTAEWLFFVPGSREVRLFERRLDEIKIADRFKEGKSIEERTRPNALFLSVVAQFNGTLAGKILAWFRQFNINLGVDDDSDLRLAVERFQQAEDKQAILRFVQDLDLGIHDIHSEPVVPSAMARSWTGEMARSLTETVGILSRYPIPEDPTKIKTGHRKYDVQGNVVGVEVFDLDAQESAGTRRLFSLAVPILDALSGGHVLFIDELDARLHPLVAAAVIGLFNSKKSNPNNAQILFTTHDTNLLSNRLFRRDQIWFVEKDRFGATHLYSLAEFQVRNDASFERDYMQGRYGAVPFIHGDLPALTAHANGQE